MDHDDESNALHSFEDEEALRYELSQTKGVQEKRPTASSTYDLPTHVDPSYLDSLSASAEVGPALPPAAPAPAAVVPTDSSAFLPGSQPFASQSSVSQTPAGTQGRGLYSQGGSLYSKRSRPSAAAPAASAVSALNAAPRPRASGKGDASVAGDYDRMDDDYDAMEAEARAAAAAAEAEWRSAAAAVTPAFIDDDDEEEAEAEAAMAAAYGLPKPPVRSPKSSPARTPAAGSALRSTPIAKPLFSSPASSTPGAGTQPSPSRPSRFTPSSTSSSSISAGLSSGVGRRLPPCPGSYPTPMMPASGSVVALTSRLPAPGCRDGQTLTRRWYCALESAEDHTERVAGVAKGLDALAAAAGRGGAGAGLLSRPVAVLIAEAEEAMMEAARAKEAAEVAAAEEVLQLTGPSGAGAGAGKSSKKKSKKSSSTDAASTDEQQQLLLVDKYAPQRYTELLSSELTNRDVATWLRQWDEKVFRRPVPAALNPPPRRFDGGNAPGSASASAFGGGRGGARGSGPAGADAAAAAPDRQDGPDHKILLLAGPPGAGKTTLAHVAARHCGYRVLEINASDDRSFESVAARIKGAVETENVMGDKRPNCLVLDEIDGALGGDDGEARSGPDTAVGLLVAMALESKARAKARAKGGAGDGADEKKGGDDSDDDDDGAAAGAGDDASKKASGKKVKKGGSSSGGGVTRPIICVCNDPFAPCLRPLLPHVKLIHVEPVARDRLVPRLTAVAKQEAIPCEPRALTALADMVNCDVRACLHTLQFVRARMPASSGKKGKTSAGVQKLTVEYLQRLSVGEKDMGKSALALWEAILTTRPLPQALRAPAFQAAGGAADIAETAASGKPGAAAKRPSAGGASVFVALPPLLLDHGLVDKAWEGVHHNYLWTPCSDPDLSRLVAAADALATVDFFGPTRSDFLPYLLLGVRTALNTARRPSLEFPRAASLWRARKGDAVIDAFFGPESPYALQSVPKREGPLYLFSFIQDIVSPAVSASSFHLLSPAERKKLTLVVDALLELGLTFTRAPLAFAASFSAHGGPPFVLSPDIAQLTTFHASLDPAFYGYGQGMGQRTRGSRPPPTVFDAHRGLLLPGPTVTGTGPGAGAGGDPSATVGAPRRQLPSHLKEALAREVEFERVRREEAVAAAARERVQREREVEQERARRAAAAAASRAARARAMGAGMDDLDDDDDEEEKAAAPIFRPLQLHLEVTAEARAAAAEAEAAAAAAAASTGTKATSAETKPVKGAIDMKSFITRKPRPAKKADTAPGAPTSAEAEEDSKAKAAREHRERFPLAFVFTEGFSNAVKRTVKMSTFM